MDIERPQPNESWLEFFKRTGRFSDLLLLAWSQIEFDVDQLVAREFGIHYDDRKAILLLSDWSFGKKLNFLRKMDKINKADYDIIHQFQEYRNKLFHGKEPFFMILSESEKEPIVKNAFESVMILQSIGFDTRYKSTGA